MQKIVPEEQRRFAVDVVRRLRGAGFEAYWAGGCVRDRLLGRRPSDYDVATDAEPDRVREIFGRRRTLPIGAAFGVITVRGPRNAGMIEVATFRRDAEYSDGRHPDSVSFSSAAEDASRRDFTINGLFYDPIEERVIDFVDGQRDIAARVIRAIGSAHDRFAEDKLRMLRAVRFAATFDFALDGDARAAIAEMADEIHAVSPERIAVEMRKMLAHSNRALAVRLLLETGLATAILPEIVPGDEEALAWLVRLGDTCSFPAAMAALLANRVDSSGAEAIGRRWRLSNDERERMVWLLDHLDALSAAESMRWSKLQPLLIAEGIGDLVRLSETASAQGLEAAAYCRKLLDQPRELLDPPPLLTGDDLRARGIPPGPQYKIILQRIRDAQLDGEIETFDEAVGIVESGEWRVEREE